MTTWQSQYIPAGDPMDPEGWYVRTEWDEGDERRLIFRVKGDEWDVAEVARWMNERTKADGEKFWAWIAAGVAMDDPELIPTLEATTGETRAFFSGGVPRD